MGKKEKLDIETFGRIVDKAIYDSDVAILAEFPKGTMEPVIKCNMPGSVCQFYMIQLANKKIFENMKKEMGADECEWEKFLDELLKILKHSILNEPGDYTPDHMKEG